MCKLRGLQFYDMSDTRSFQQSHWILKLYYFHILSNEMSEISQPKPD